MGFQKRIPMPSVDIVDEHKVALNKYADQGVQGAQTAIDKIAYNWFSHREAVAQTLDKYIPKMEKDHRRTEESAQDAVIRTGRELFNRCIQDIAGAETLVVRAIDLLQSRKGGMQVSPDEELAIRQRLASGLQAPPKLSKLTRSQVRALLSYSDSTLQAMGFNRWQLITRIDPKAEDRLTRLQGLLDLLQSIMSSVYEQQYTWEESIREIPFIPPEPVKSNPRPTLPPARL